MHAGAAHPLQCVQPVLIVAGTDDVAIKFRRRVQIVVVVIEARLFQLLSLLVVEHPQRGAGLHPEAAHGLDHFNHTQHVRIGRLAPGSAHAETIRACLLCGASGFHHFIELQHFPVFHIRRMERGLRAIAAILRTSARLDRQQRGELHLIRIKMFAVHLLRAVQQIGKRQPEQGFHLINGEALRGDGFFNRLVKCNRLGVHV